jgi:hypothetical protein
MTYRMTGHLQRGTEPNTIVGELRDPTFGFVYVLSGTRTAEGYALEGTPGPVPDDLKLPWDDDE